MSTKTKQGTSLSVTIFLIFLILKLTNTISWSWLWVTSPLWIGFALIILLFTIGVFISFCAIVLALIFGAK